MNEHPTTETVRACEAMLRRHVERNPLHRIGLDKDEVKRLLGTGTWGQRELTIEQCVERMIGYLEDGQWRLPDEIAKAVGMSVHRLKSMIDRAEADGYVIEKTARKLLGSKRMYRLVNIVDERVVER